MEQPMLNIKNMTAYSDGVSFLRAEPCKIPINLIGLALHQPKHHRQNKNDQMKAFLAYANIERKPFIWEWLDKQTLKRLFC